MQKVNQFKLDEKQNSLNQKGIDQETFNSDQYKKEITALAQTLYFENNHNYSIVKEKLLNQGLNENQCHSIVETLKVVNSKMVDDFQKELDSGRISEMKIQPNPDHKKRKVDQNQVDKYIGYGAYQLERGDLDNAIELFDKAIELDDKAALAYANKGTIYAKKGEHLKAVELYNKALEYESKNIQILENKMDSLYEIMDEIGENKFIESVNACLSLDEKSPNALIYMIQYHLKHSDLDSALKLLKNLFSEYYSEQFVIQLLQQIFNSINDKRKALIEFSKLEEGMVDSAKYQLNYCKALYLKGINEFEEAIQLFEDLNILHQFSWNYYQIAIIKNLQNKLDESISFLQRTFELEPDLKNDAKQYEELQNLWSNPKFIEITK